MAALGPSQTKKGLQTFWKPFVRCGLFARARLSRCAQRARVSATGPAELHEQRAWTADVILEQLERDALSDGERIEGEAVTDVAAVEEHRAAIRQPDEAVALADQQRDDSTRARRAAALVGSTRRVLASRRCRRDSASSVLAHVATSAVPTAGAENGRRRTHHHRVPASGGLR